MVVLIFTNLLACNDTTLNTNNLIKSGAESSDQASGISSPQKAIDFCSRLDLQGIRWPSDLSGIEIDAYALALNITGSFEGHKDWQNITNNFDGQGISLGLFQQNLGQGSLQPLLIDIAQEDENLFSDYFTSSQIQTIYRMLEVWDANSGLSLSSVKTKLGRTPANSSTIIDHEALTQFYSPLDIESSENIKPGMVGEKVIEKASNSANQLSVDWALDNLYESNGRTFKASWFQGFTRLAGDPEYITRQVEAANIINAKALAFMDLYGTRELRSYLFFFDIVVQNGGIRDSTRQLYLDEISKTPNMSENDKMKVLIKHRVLRSRAEFREDVLSRKLAILNGEGFVHQTQRDFRSEFCMTQYNDNIR